jgi:uncharacterized protein (DUF362 family)
LGQIKLPAPKGKRVLIKPNAGRMAKAGEGITTDPQVVAGLIDYLRERGGDEIFVGESPILGVKALEALEFTGISEVCHKRSIPLIDLDDEPPVTTPVKRGKLLRNLKICKEVLRSDFIVSVPVMKTHMHTVVSLGIKNMKGCLRGREKARLHQIERNDKICGDYKTLDVAIADMTTVLRPDLTVVDGTVGMEGLGPSAGKKKPMGVVVSGMDPYLTDAVSAVLMGIDPGKIPHLALSAERIGKSIYMEDVDLIPKDAISRWRNPFELPPQEISFKYPNVVVYDRGSCSACLSSALLFLERYLEVAKDYRLSDGYLHIAIGKEIKDFPSGTLLIGDCTARYSHEGIFVKGCPPVPSHILEVLKKEGGR